MYLSLSKSIEQIKSKFQISTHGAYSLVTAQHGSVAIFACSFNDCLYPGFVWVLAIVTFRSVVMSSKTFDAGQCIQAIDECNESNGVISGGKKQTIYREQMMNLHVNIKIWGTKFEYFVKKLNLGKKIII